MILKFVIRPVPFGKFPQSFFNRRFWLKIKVALQFADVSIGLIDIAGLHGQVLLLRRLAEGFFQNFNEMHELFRFMVANVIDFIRIA